jgi:hypothetical protein
MSTPALTMHFLFQAGSEAYSEHYPFQPPHQGARRPVIRGQEAYGYDTRQKATYLDEPDREDYRDPAASSEFQYYEDEADPPEREYAPQSAGIVRPPGQLSSLVRRPAPNRRFSLPPGWPPFCKKLVFYNCTV